MVCIEWQKRSFSVTQYSFCYLFSNEFVFQTVFTLQKYCEWIFDWKVQVLADIHAPWCIMHSPGSGPVMLSSKTDHPNPCTLFCQLEFCEWLLFLPRVQAGFMHELVFFFSSSFQLLCLVGEAFDDYSDDVCGAVVNIRTKGDKIAVWTSDYENREAVTHIGWGALTFINTGDAILRIL